MHPTFPLLPSSAGPLPEWLVLRGRITRAQRLELERRFLPKVSHSPVARYILEDMHRWSAARATAELLTHGTCTVPIETKRDLRFSVGYTMVPGLLPRREYMAFKRIRRVFSPLCKDYMFAQPGETYDYCLGQN